MKPEVFREMLSTFGEESRLHVIAEQLLKHKAEWVKGRWRVPTKNELAGKVAKDADPSPGEGLEGKMLVPVEEEFRREGYKRAAKLALYQEFKALSRSTVDGVLAECNHSYSLARPTLQRLVLKSWRNSLSTFLSKWKKPSQEGSHNHFMISWVNIEGSEDAIPRLKATGDEELAVELSKTVLEPLLRMRREEQEDKDLHMAVEVNEQQAEEAEALHECECCFSDTTFEQMATCTTRGHVICFRCLRRAVSEALFGQGWGKNIDHERGQIKCLAPMLMESCIGYVPQSLVRRAVEQERVGALLWRKLESRLADEALLKAQVALVRCPFCTYAEIDSLYLPPNTSSFRLNTRHPPRFVIAIFLASLFLLPILPLYTYLSILFPKHLDHPRILIANSLTHLNRLHHHPLRFTCASPTCLRSSCLNCSKPWRDPHTCHESSRLSLRTTIEAARTAALKRTCPRCGLGFIKESGCNKLTCVCGYLMCYICRQGLGRGSGGNAAEGEGYRHFCQHFRPAGGRCTECERCDLYREEDEDVLVRTAGERAEREWREREGMVGVKGLGGQDKFGVGKTGFLRGGWEGCGIQDLVDWVGEMVLTC